MVHILAGKVAEKLKTVIKKRASGGAIPLKALVYKNIFAKCPAGRLGTADEMANIAELLLSDAGAFITGSTFLADGGATASYYYGPLQPTE